MAAQPSRAPRTRIQGVELGPYGAGFEVQTERPRPAANAAADGTARRGLAIWYPAVPGSRGTGMTSLDYRLLPHGEVGGAERTRLIDEHVEPLLSSRHVGIVPLSRAQAFDALQSGGIAVRGAPSAAGRFPVVMLFGGAYYLATTAEMLATRGFVVCVGFRLATPSTAPWDFPTYVENSVRDGEWAVEELRRRGNADLSRIGAFGHGGGGLHALLFAMRNSGVAALVNIDSGNFSSRTEPSKLPSYSPARQRAPYLYIATADTRKTQDLFADFTAMTGSDRYEVILQDPAVRHHDLSDVGRAVTEPLQIRGEAQAVVQRAFVTVQELVARFFAAQLRSGPERPDALGAWMQQHSATRAYAVQLHPRREQN